MVNERLSKSKELLLNTAQVLGGLVVTEAGIIVIEQDPNLGNDIIGATTSTVGAIVAVRGANYLMDRFLSPNQETDPDT